VLVCSTEVQSEHTTTVFDLLQAGALDVFPKPRTGLEDGNLAELIRKIKVLSGVKVFRSRRAVHDDLSPTGAANGLSRKPQAVVIGASTGGPGALQTLFKALPANFPLPILCVQHIAGEFAKGLVSWLADQSKLPINFARGGESFQRGTITFPAPGCNLHVGPSGLIAMTPLDADSMGASVDATMMSAAKYWGAGTVGVLLTGMGSDGAQGMLAISRAGGTTIAQNAETSVIFGMPERAIALGAAQSVLPLGEIAPALLRLVASTHG
jgi:two-component system chemotaxis response regulator CheB